MASPTASTIPADFADYARGRCWREICARFGISRSTLTIWRRETAIAQGARVAWSTEEDGYLHANYRARSLGDIAAHLGRSVEAVKARAKKLGIQPPKRSVYVRRETQTHMMSGHSGEAAYLQCFGAIYRCHGDGTANAAGAYWYWAGEALSHDEMEAKARAHRERRALLAS